MSVVVAHAWNGALLDGGAELLGKWSPPLTTFRYLSLPFATLRYSSLLFRYSFATLPLLFHYSFYRW